MSELIPIVEYWRERLARDLAPFADAGTEVSVSGAARTLRAEWSMRGDSRTAEFHVSPELGLSVRENGKETDYRSFLVGPGMADLMALAKAIVRTRHPRLYVDTDARLVTAEGGGVEEGQPAAALLRSVVATAEPDATRVTMVTGEAGAGKTQVLSEVVRRQAEAFVAGKTPRLLLYVNAQGRALARFSEALAVELDDLRSPLNYHHVTILTKVGALVPVIDGFDELLGVSGYDDAFSSLAAFIEELDGNGQVVASARSSYYQEEFVSRASTQSSLGSQAWSQVVVQVEAWGDEEIDEFVRGKASELGLAEDAAESLAESLSGVFQGRALKLREKPLFVARVVELLAADIALEGGDDLLQELVENFLERERHEKLLDRSGAPLLTSPQIARLLDELSEEMWNQETRELDRRSVREIAEFVLTLEGLADATIAIVMERMPTLAFLSPGQREGAVGFEHEVFFAHFLGRVFAARIAEGGDSLRVLLGRSVLPPEVGRTAYLRLTSRGPAVDEVAVLEGLLSEVSSAGAGEGARITQVRENSGRVLQEALASFFEAREGPLERVAVENVTFAGGALLDVHLVSSQLSNVQFRRTDLSRTRFEKCTAANTVLVEPTVAPDFTRLELAGLDPATQVVGLRVVTDGQPTSVYDPDALHEALVAIGVLEGAEDSDARPIPRAFMDLLERLMRAYRRANPVCTSDDTMRGLFRDANWPALETLLVNCGIVTVETRATRGPTKEFLRRQFLPEEVMAGARRRAPVAPEISLFWDSLEKEEAK